jgi:hypothetical protein
VRSIFSTRTPPMDIRASVMATAALMLLLLPLALLCTSLERRAAIPLSLSGGEGVKANSGGSIAELRIARTETGFAVTTLTNSTDIRALPGQHETRVLRAKDLSELHRIARQLKALDPSHTETTLIPSPTSTTSEVVRWMDVLRGGPSDPLFPQIVLQTY